MQAVKESLEHEFNAIGLASYFDTGEDNHVGWEVVFDIDGIREQSNKEVQR